MNEGLVEVSKMEAYKRLNFDDWNKVNKYDGWFENEYNEYPTMKFFKSNDGILGVYEHKSEAVVTIQLVANLDYKRFTTN